MYVYMCKDRVCVCVCVCVCARARVFVQLLLGPQTYEHLGEDVPIFLPVLVMAAHRGNVEVARLLLERGAHVDEASKVSKPRVVLSLGRAPSISSTITKFSMRGFLHSSQCAHLHNSIRRALGFAEFSSDAVGALYNGSGYSLVSFRPQ
jgi:hypothetical protein